MSSRLNIEILPQPDSTSCGPTCLHAIYRYYKDNIPLEKLISEVKKLDEGGTLAVFLGCHALKRGYKAAIYTYNLQIFDPTWFKGNVNLAEKLKEQAKQKKDTKLRMATQGYLEYLSMGGEILHKDLSHSLLKKYLFDETPILTGLSATSLYNSSRECGLDPVEDDIRGEPSGHFVVLSGYNRKRKRILISDPYSPNPFSKGGYYHVGISRLIQSILLGIITYDANLLVITR